MRLHLAEALLPEGPRDLVALSFDAEGRITEIGDADPDQALPGVAFPGLINAHCHLDLAGPRVSAEGGLPGWVRGLPSPSPGPERVWQAIEGFCAGIVDISNALATEGALRRSSLAHVVHHEVLGIEVETLPATGGDRPSPHAAYSTSAALIRQAVAVEGPMACIHCDEDPAERDFLMTGGGPWAALMRSIGRDLSGFEVPGCTPVQYLDRLGVLDERLALVHCTLTGPKDLDLVAERGATVILCPRSNLHITGRLPDLPGILERGIPLALGTDSLASCPDLDLRQEIRVLLEAFPQVDPWPLWQAATQGGARVMGRADLGRIEVGACPGLWNHRGWLVPPREPSC